MSRPINTCVLGVGLAALTFHVPFILALPQLFTLHSVLERNPKTAGGKVHRRFGVSVKTRKTLGDVLSDPEVELVVVATPNETHYEFAKAALQAGKHVLVDTPVTAIAEQARELGDLAQSKGLIIYAFQIRRWDSDFLSLKSLLALRESHPEHIGTILEFESHFDRYRKDLKHTWREKSLPAAGALWDLGVHLTDQALALFGRPQAVTAFIQNIRGLGDPAVDDSFTVRLHYEPNRTRRYPLSIVLRSQPLSVRSPQLRYIVRGTQGTYIKHAILQEEFGREPEYLHGRIEKILIDDETIIESTWPTPDAGGYLELYQNLGAAIRAGAKPAVKWTEATAVIEIIELAHESSKKRKTISIPTLAQ